jgi:DNA-binding response OmpR family regulator
MTIKEYRRTTRDKGHAKLVTGKHILVIDDEESMRKLVARALETEGFSVMLASGGEVALELMEEREPDLVILDIKMPGMNGFQVLEVIRQRSDIPVIMLSGLGEVTTIRDALIIGADDFLRKPFYARELLARVKAKLRRCSNE